MLAILFLCHDYHHAPYSVPYSTSYSEKRVCIMASGRLFHSHRRIVHWSLPARIHVMLATFYESFHRGGECLAELADCSHLPAGHGCECQHDVSVKSILLLRC